MSKQNFSSLEIDGEPITHEEISEITKIVRERHPLETQVYSGSYIITDIHFDNDTIFLDVENMVDGSAIKYVNVLKALISEDDYQWFKDSANRQAVDLTIVTTEKKGVIINAFLQSFNK